MQKIFICLSATLLFVVSTGISLNSWADASMDQKEIQQSEKLNQLAQEQSHGRIKGKHKSGRYKKSRHKSAKKKNSVRLKKSATKHKHMRKNKTSAKTNPANDKSLDITPVKSEAISEDPSLENTAAPELPEDKEVEL